MRILLGDQTGQVKAEVAKGNIGDVEWRLNEAGTARVNIAHNTPAFRQDILEPGARIYVEFDNGLPAWGGVLDLPRYWQPGMLETRAYTIERLLKFQMTARTRSFYDVVVGDIFTKILQEADQRAAIGLAVGHVWWGGASHFPRYHFRDVMWIINKSLRQMEMCDYRFVPYLSNNRIMFRCELYDQLGEDRRNQVALIEGKNVTRPELSEQGNIINRMAVAGTGSTWNEREVVVGLEENSLQRYGLRETMLMPADVSQPASLSRYADNAIRDNAYPHTLATLGLADISPSRFADYDVGDVVRVQLSSLGFDGYDAPMRVVARGFNPSSGECQVVCDERFEYEPIIQGEDERSPTED